MKIKIGLLSMIITVVILCSYGLASDTNETNEQKKRKVPHITAQQAYTLFQQGKIILVDVHPGPNKTHATIVGAFYVSAHEIQKRNVALPRDKLIGLYCE